MPVNEYFRASANNLLRAIEERRREISNINADITTLRARVTTEKSSIQREKTVRMSNLSTGQTERKNTEDRMRRNIEDLNRQLQGAAEGDKSSIQSQIQSTQNELDNFLKFNAEQAANNLRELQDEQNDLKKLEADVNRQIAEKQNQIRALEQDIVETERLMQALQQRAG